MYTVQTEHVHQSNLQGRGSTVSLRISLLSIFERFCLFLLDCKGREEEGEEKIEEEGEEKEERRRESGRRRSPDY